MRIAGLKPTGPLWVLAGVMLATTVLAGEWKFTPRFQIEETYTDNVNLTENDRDGDFITSLTPGFSLRGNSARVQTAVDYNRRERFFIDQSDLNDGNNQLQSNVDTTLLENWLYFGTVGRMSQQSIDSRLGFSQIDRGNNGNLSDVTSYELTPRIKHTFGGWGTMDLSYSRQNIERKNANSASTIFQNGFDQAAGSSDADSFDLDLRSGPRSGRFPVGLRARSRKLEYLDGRVQKFKSISSDISYVWNRQFRSTVRGGYDDQSYDTARGVNSGVTWSIGGTWTPSQRTTFELEWGDRFFGKSLKVTANHRLRRWQFNFNYDKQIRTSSDFERGLVLVPLFDDVGLPVFDPVTSGQIFVPIDSPGVTSDVFIEERMVGSMGYKMRRTDVKLSYFQYDREFQTTLRDNRTRGVSFNVTRRMQPRTRALLTLQWRDNRDSTVTSDGLYYTIAPSLEYDLSRYTTARLRYEYTSNDHSNVSVLGGNPEHASFFENAISAALIVHM